MVMPASVELVLLQQTQTAETHHSVCNSANKKNCSLTNMSYEYRWDMQLCVKRLQSILLFPHVQKVEIAKRKQKL